MEYELRSWEAAKQALRDAEIDCAADHGPEYVDEAFADLVDSVAIFCDPETRRELYRTEGCSDRVSGLLVE